MVAWLVVPQTRAWPDRFPRSHERVGPVSHRHEKFVKAVEPESSWLVLLSDGRPPLPLPERPFDWRPRPAGRGRFFVVRVGTEAAW